jgi:hypothetical protein
MLLMRLAIKLTMTGASWEHMPLRLLAQPTGQPGERNRSRNVLFNRPLSELTPSVAGGGARSGRRHPVRSVALLESWPTVRQHVGALLRSTFIG